MLTRRDGCQSIISLVFFITYVIFQPPSTVIVRKLGPRTHLAVIAILWGACMIGMGFVKDWEQMAGLRVLLGVLEAGGFSPPYPLGCESENVLTK